MIERRNGPRFLLKSPHAIRVCHEVIAKIRPICACRSGVTAASEQAAQIVQSLSQSSDVDADAACRPYFDFSGLNSGTFTKFATRVFHDSKSIARIW